MQVYPNKLADNLRKGLAGCYLIFGDEPQQKFEAIDHIRALAKQQGFDERQSLLAHTDFNWNSLIEAGQSMSLFSARQLIELELPTGKPGTEGSAALVSFADSLNPDTLLVVHGPKIGKDVQRTKWFKALDKHGVYVPCYPVEGRHLQQWISNKLAQAGLPASQQICAMIGDFCEGNLLAAKQEIDKLALLHPDGNLTPEAIQQSLIDQSRYDVFQLIDLLLEGDSQRAVKVLYSLESEGVEPNFVLWAMIREWQTLHTLSYARQHGEQINWNKLRIWQNRQRLYQGALNRHSPATLEHLRNKLEYMDLALKSESVARPYVELCHLCLLFIPISLQHLELSA